MQLVSQGRAVLLKLCSACFANRHALRWSGAICCAEGRVQAAPSPVSSEAIEAT